MPEPRDKANILQTIKVSSAAGCLSMQGLSEAQVSKTAALQIPTDLSLLQARLPKAAYESEGRGKANCSIPAVMAQEHRHTAD